MQQRVRSGASRPKRSSLTDSGSNGRYFEPVTSRSAGAVVTLCAAFPIGEEAGENRRRLAYGTSVQAADGERGPDYCCY